MILPGTVAAVDAGNARVRVESDGRYPAGCRGRLRLPGLPGTGVCPVSASRSSCSAHPGEPARVCPDRVFTPAHGYDSRPDVVAWQMPDGGKIEYDFASSAVLVDGCKTVTVNPASVTIDAPETTITGNVTAASVVRCLKVAGRWW